MSLVDQEQTSELLTPLEHLNSPLVFSEVI
jgi:hypothetical protein